MNNKLLQVTSEQKSYISGFLDGDGCILAQIVRQSCSPYGFQIRVGIHFYQKTSRSWHLEGLKKMLGYGTIRKRPDGISEYSIVGFSAVKLILEALLPHIIMKRKLASLVLQIIELHSKVQTADDFLQVCYLVDKSAILRDSKRRTLTALVVQSYLSIPVETEAK
uniref:Putative site-specific DNA endonuclease n=1 Tax=Nephroselmis olivacea TaxID=31312 RepID=Q9TCC6_NEPOL|nr:putative site-specific DNA endonuclease [Nephroselmis olivacea]AAF03171.1 putative site-specific DNA endonuclease [Nephroselmis olivacea]